MITLENRDRPDLSPDLILGSFLRAGRHSLNWMSYCCFMSRKHTMIYAIYFSYGGGGSGMRFTIYKDLTIYENLGFPSGVVNNFLKTISL